MSLGVKLKTLRMKSGKSLQNLADEVGASKAHIWELETGKSKNPSIELLLKIAKALKASVADLIGENPSHEDAPSEVVAMYRDLQTLQPTDLETIRIMIERLQQKADNT